MVGENEEQVSGSEDGDVAVNQAVVRAGYKSLMENIVGNEEELGDVQNCRLYDYMETNEALYEQVVEPQEAVMDARVIKQLSRLCRQQAEGMSANINQFNQQEFAERLVANMTGGEVGQPIAKKKWVLLGKQVKGMFQRSPCLTYLYGALDTTPPPPKERKQRDPKARQATRVRDLVATQETVLEEAEKSENQTEVMVGHVMKCLVSCWKENNKQPINFFEFVIDPASFGSSVENLFHVSFLVKEGKVDISLDAESGLPFVRPFTKRQGAEEGEGEVKNQVVMNLCMEDWERLKAGLDIRRAMISRSTEQRGAEKRPRV